MQINLLTLRMVQDPKTRRQKLRPGSLLISRSCFFLFMATSKTKVPFLLVSFVWTGVIDFGFLADSGKIEVDSKSTINDLGTNSEEPSIDVKTEKGRPSFPKWYLDVFAGLFLCIIIALSFLFTSPQQSSPFIAPPHLELPSIPPLTLPSLSILWLLPAFSVLSLVIMAIRSGYIPIHHKEKGNLLFSIQIFCIHQFQDLTIFFKHTRRQRGWFQVY